MQLDCAGIEVDLSFPQVMGILNVTPDSFSDGGCFVDLDVAVNQAEKMVEAGAMFVDIGGESTRPGAQPVSLDEETRRVIPVIEKLRQRDLPAVICIDTSKAELMRRAVEAGAAMINDVYALKKEHALQTAADLNVPVCLMHMQGTPGTMQKNPGYKNVVEDVYSFLQDRIRHCVEAGLGREKLLVDPGFGFGKTLQQNLSLLKHLAEFAKFDVPVLAGLSRKSMIGAILGKDVDERLAGSITMACFAMSAGVSILRVHDVDETVDAVRIFSAIRNAD